MQISWLHSTKEEVSKLEAEKFKIGSGENLIIVKLFNFMTNALKSSYFVTGMRHYNHDILLHNNLSKTYKVVLCNRSWNQKELHFYYIWSFIHFIVFSSMILLLQDQQAEPNDDVAGTEAGMFCSIINKRERFKTRV